jgi:hypothetical protein
MGRYVNIRRLIWLKQETFMTTRSIAPLQASTRGNTSRALWLSPVLAALLLGGCANMTPEQQKTAQGAAIGAVAGAVISKATGNKAATGAVLVVWPVPWRVTCGRAAWKNSNERWKPPPRAHRSRSPAPPTTN